jgi:ferrous iron transport protein B
MHNSPPHHSLRELLEDASVRPFSGALISVCVLVLSFKVVRFIGEGLINSVADPIFTDFYQPFLDKISFFLGPGRFLHHLLIGDLIDGKIDFKQSLGLLIPDRISNSPWSCLIVFFIGLGTLGRYRYFTRLAMFWKPSAPVVARVRDIPVLLGLGCNVPGILATRNMESRRERFITATLISIGIPCVALQAMIFGLLGASSGFYVAGVCLVLLVIWVVLGTILNHTIKGYSPELLVEIPPYRLPSLSTLWKKLFLRIKGFVIEAAPWCFWA